MNECKCTLLEKLNEAHYELKKRVDNIEKEQNTQGKTIIGIERDLKAHIKLSEERSTTLIDGISNLTSSLKEHMQEEKDTMKTINSHITSELAPIKEELKQLDGVKLKTGIMWSIVVSLAGALLAMGIFFIQDFHTRFTETEKQVIQNEKIN